MKLRKLVQEAVENGKMRPPVTVLCTDPEDRSIYVRLKIDVDAQGKLHEVEPASSGIIPQQQLPPRLDMRMTDVNKRTITAQLSKPDFRE